MHPTSLEPLVILLHGLHQRHWVMLPLKKHLHTAGFRTHGFNYFSLIQPIERHSLRLHEWLLKHHDPAAPLHLVGHSLGGLVSRDFMQRYPNWKVERCVTLGTPHLGSMTARHVKRYFAPAVTKAYPNGLNGEAADLVDNVRLGVIAGNKAHAIGKLFFSWHTQANLQYLTKLIHEQAQQEKTSSTNNEILTAFKQLDACTDEEQKRVSDGTVFVAETMLPNASDHIILPVTHTGMLFNAEVAKQTLHFLHHGHFDKQTLP